MPRLAELRIPGAAAVLVTAVVGAPGPADAGGAPARAHARLVRTDPGDGARLTSAPAAIVLTFDDPVDARLSRTELSGPGGRLTVVPNVDGARARVPLPGPAGLARLLRGSDATPVPLTLTYRVVSSDGHPVSGRMRVHLDVAATGATTEPPAATSPGTAAPPTASPEPAQTGSGPAWGLPGTDGGPGNGVPRWAVVALGVLAAAAGALALARRRTPGRPPEVRHPDPDGQDRP